MFRKSFFTFAIFVAAGFFVLQPVNAEAQFVGQIERFFVNKEYDASERSEIPAMLAVISQRANIYVDEAWWSGLNPFEQGQARRDLTVLGSEFDGIIYPGLTNTFGAEQRPGGAEPITILFHSMKEEAGGYTNSGDEYEKAQVPTSNERKIMYLNTDYAGASLAKSFLAHEFTHLITFYQKDIVQKVSEDVWLNEARAEYAPTMLGYDDRFAGSNLAKRVEQFTRNPSDSLLEWEGEEKDYGVVNLFAQYVADHYGAQVLVDSLRSSQKGVQSLQEALEKAGYTDTFQEVFENWTIAVLVNDCELGPRYCYKNPLLRDMRIVPQTNFIPLAAGSTLSLVETIRDWTAAWSKIIGGNGNLHIEFQGNPQARFKIPYILEKNSGEKVVRFMEGNETQKGIVDLPNFGNYRSITLIPAAQTNASQAQGLPMYQYVVTITSSATVSETTQAYVGQLLAQIAELQAEIARLRGLLGIESSSGCSALMRDLRVGLQNDADVKCLQEVLVAQGPDIYPEALVTGNFLSLTKAAVIRFQEKYATEILHPLDLQEGTGFVGPSTRKKLNELR